MNDKELGKALLTLETTPKPSELDPRSLGGISWSAIGGEFAC